MLYGKHLELFILLCRDPCGHLDKGFIGFGFLLCNHETNMPQNEYFNKY